MRICHFIGYLLLTMALTACGVWDSIEDENELYYKTTDVVQISKSAYNKALTLVIIPDGFTEEDLQKNNGKFITAARHFFDTFFLTEPFASYKEHFNAYALIAESEVSGTQAGNFFGSSYANGVLTCNAEDVFDFVERFCPDIFLNATRLEDCAILVLVNDTHFSARTYFYSRETYQSISIASIATNSKGGYRLGWLSSDPFLTRDTTWGDWSNAAVHEIGGHAIGRLGDEYWTSATSTITDEAAQTLLARQQASAPFGLNVALVERGKKLVPWYNNWIQNKPQSSSYTHIDCYTGGFLYAKGIWRPEPYSCMDNNKLYFNAPSRERIVRRILQVTGINFNRTLFLRKDKTSIAHSSLWSWDEPASKADMSEGPIPLLPPAPEPIWVE